MAPSTQKADLLAQIEHLKLQAEALPEDVFKDEKSRRTLREATLKLAAFLETRVDGLNRIFFQAIELTRSPKKPNLMA